MDHFHGLHVPSSEEVQQWLNDFSEKVQAQFLSGRGRRGTNRFRSIEEYDERLAAANSDFRIRKHVEKAALEGRFTWVDVPSGVGVALQQGVSDYPGRIRAFGVDIVDWNRSRLEDKEVAELRRRHSAKDLEKLFAKESFSFIRRDMKDVRIPGGADLITSICGIYYHEDPMGVWENLFDQLLPGGTFVTHFMFPKRYPEIPEAYRKLVDALNAHASAEISFSADERDVVEAVIVARRTGQARLRVEREVRSVRPFRARWGRSGFFEIRAVDYAFPGAPVTALG